MTGVLKEVTGWQAADGSFGLRGWIKESNAEKRRLR